MEKEEADAVWQEKACISKIKLCRQRLKGNQLHGEAKRLYQLLFKSTMVKACAHRCASSHLFYGKRTEAKETDTQKMIQKIDSEKGRECYNQRMGVIEPVFANKRSTLRLDRFSLPAGKS